MRSILLMGFVFLLSVFVSCDYSNDLIAPESTDSTKIEVRFVEQPQGGIDVDTLDVTVEARLIDGTTQPLVIEWWHENIYGKQPKISRQDTFQVNGTEWMTFRTFLTFVDELWGWYWVEINKQSLRSLTIRCE